VLTCVITEKEVFPMKRTRQAGDVSFLMGVFCIFTFPVVLLVGAVFFLLFFIKHPRRSAGQRMLLIKTWRER
jgi:hypothetical protein